MIWKENLSKSLSRVFNGRSKWDNWIIIPALIIFMMIKDKDIFDAAYYNKRINLTSVLSKLADKSC